MKLKSCPYCDAMSPADAIYCIHCTAPFLSQSKPKLIVKLNKFSTGTLFPPTVDVIGLFDSDGNKVISLKMDQVKATTITKPLKLKAYHIQASGEKVTLFGMGEKTCSNELTVEPGKTQKIRIDVQTRILNHLFLSFDDEIESE